MLWRVTYTARTFKEAANLISYAYPAGMVFCVFSKITHRRVWYKLEGYGRVLRLQHASVRAHVPKAERERENKLFPRFRAPELPRP